MQKRNCKIYSLEHLRSGSPAYVVSLIQVSSQKFSRGSEVFYMNSSVDNCVYSPVQSFFCKRRRSKSPIYVQKGLGKRDVFGKCEKTCEAASCGAPGEQKAWGEAGEVAWMERGRALNDQVKGADFLCRDLDKLLNGRVNFGSEDDDGLEREEP